jgi:Ca2+-binding RTX toxin-like protein
LTGDSNANSINGNTGVDNMAGGLGNDSYYIDSTGDVVTELAGGGVDTVYTYINYLLGSELENARILGAGALDLTGNAVANVLYAGSGNNILDGGGGVDTLSYAFEVAAVNVDLNLSVAQATSGSGSDTILNVENLTGSNFNDRLTGNTLANALSGGTGDDTLIGGGGADTLTGGAGNDSYTVDIAGDVVVESGNSGLDSVSSSVTYTLAGNVENLILTGAALLAGTGNTGDNLLIGNSGANTLTALAGNDTLDGGTGNDTMVGGAGNDSYIVNVTTDVVTELANEGIDTIQSSVALTLGGNVENLTLAGSAALSGTGNTLNNLLSGNSGVNTLSGLAGNDTLSGGLGNDTMIGAAGADTYIFSSGWGIDTIQDSDATVNVKDVVMLQGGLTQADVRFSQLGNNLEMLIAATGDKLVIQDWYLGSQFHVEEFRFSDGSIVTDTQAQGLVGALATFGASAPALIGNTPGQRVTIGVIDLAVAR